MLAELEGGGGCVGMCNYVKLGGVNKGCRSKAANQGAKSTNSPCKSGMICMDCSVELECCLKKAYKISSEQGLEPSSKHQLSCPWLVCQLCIMHVNKLTCAASAGVVLLPHSLLFFCCRVRPMPVGWPCMRITACTHPSFNHFF